MRPAHPGRGRAARREGVLGFIVICLRQQAISSKLQIRNTPRRRCFIYVKMKVLLWILVIVGGLSFVGAAADEDDSSSGSSGHSESEALAGTESCAYPEINEENIRAVINQKRTAGSEVTPDPALDSYSEERSYENYERQSAEDSAKYGTGEGQGYYRWRDQFGTGVFTEEGRNNSQPIVAPAFAEYQELSDTTEYSDTCDLIAVWEEGTFTDAALKYVGIGITDKYVVISLAKPTTPVPVVNGGQASGNTYDSYEYSGHDYSYDDYGYSEDLDCADVSYEEAQQSIGQGDPHGFDGDGDGIGCEWNY